MSELLPELKSGDALVTAAGRKVILQQIRRPKRLPFGRAQGERGDSDRIAEKKIFRVIHMLANGRRQIGNAEWTREELQAAGCTMA